METVFLRKDRARNKFNRTTHLRNIKDIRSDWSYEEIGKAVGIYNLEMIKYMSKHVIRKLRELINEIVKNTEVPMK